MRTSVVSQPERVLDRTEQCIERQNPPSSLVRLNAHNLLRPIWRRDTVLYYHFVRSIHHGGSAETDKKRNLVWPLFVALQNMKESR